MVGQPGKKEENKPLRFIFLGKKLPQLTQKIRRGNVLVILHYNVRYIIFLRSFDKDLIVIEIYYFIILYF